MFFSKRIKRRLESLLAPWLREEPELGVKIGLINSCAIAKNLRFDTSVLNGLIDESTRWSFEDVTVEYLSIRFSNWSVPSFAFEIRGIRVTLSVGEVKDEGCSGQVRKSSDRDSDDMKKALSSIDPEGSTLHDILERISVTTPRNRIKTSLLNLILNHCQLHIHDISLQVQFPSLNDSFTCLSEFKELKAESQYIEHGCLLRGFVGALFSPLKETSFIIDGNGFEIGFKREDRVNLVFSSTDLFTCISLNNLQLVDFNLRVPELSFSVSPVDLIVLIVFGKLLSKESKRTRNGRQLWKLAASRIGRLMLVPRLSLHKVVGFVGLWLRYVKAYQYLLSLVGYSDHQRLKKSIVKMSQDKTFFSSVKHYWKIISNIEKELPAEAIAQARRIARYRAALNVRNAEDSYAESFIKNHYKFFCKILLFLAFVWKVVGKVFYSIVQFFFMRNFLAQELKGDGHFRVVSEYSCPQNRFILNLGRIQITISPTNAVQPSVNEKLESQIGISFSFCLSIDSLLLIYIKDICEQALSVSCGQLLVNSLSFMGAPALGSIAKNSSSSVKGRWNGRVDDLKKILWCEPAQMFHLSETSKSSATDRAEGVYDLFLEKFLGEMWSSWKRATEEFEESEMQYAENPCLLYEIKNLLMYPGLKSSDSGTWKCGLTVGKLNLALEYSSMLSMALLLRQTQHVLCLTEDKERAKFLSRSPRTIVDPLKIDWDSKYKSYARGIKMVMHRMLPEKHVQLGALITGPHIQISLKKEGVNDSNEEMNYSGFQDDFHLALDVHNIEVAVLPTSKSDTVSLPGWRSDDLEPECLRLKDFQIIEIPKSDCVNYISQGCFSLSLYVRVNGLNAYLEGLAKKQQSQIFVAEPISVQLSSFREHLHSFGTTVNAFSAAFYGMATGFTVLLYIDELYVLFQAFEDLFSEILHDFSRFYSIGCVSFQKILRQDIMFAEPENEETIVKGAYRIYSSSLFSINGTFKLKSMDIIFHNFRMSNSVERMITSDALSIKNLAGHDLLDSGIWVSVQQSCVDISCQEEKSEVLTKFSEIQIVIFRYQDQTGKNTDHSELRNLLQGSLNSLYEISLSNCICTVWCSPLQNASFSGVASDTPGSSTSVGQTSYMVERPTLTSDSKCSSIPSINFIQTSGFTSNTPALASSHWLLITVALSEIIVARCSVKSVLIGAHQLNKLQLFLYVGGKFPRISWRIQGGFCFIEATALTVFLPCFASYISCVRNILCIVQSSGKHMERAQHDWNMNRQNDHFIEESALETNCTSPQAKWELLEAFSIDLSEFSLVLVLEDESGGIRELVVEVDFHLNLELENMRRQIIFDISRLSILSQVLHGSVKNDIQIPHFSSVTSSNLSSHTVTEDATVTFWHRDVICPVDNASCSRNPSSQDSVSDIFSLSRRNDILKHLVAFVLAEKPVPGSMSGSLHLNQVWVGSGSVSGFDIILSLTEIQMIMSTAELFSELFSKESTSELNQRKEPTNQAFDSGLEATVANGAIVAIQDIHEHMYFTVEGGENKYSLVGTFHYSLVGERALFRVKYHIQQRWKSSVSWFSLLSLHAKNDSGEPLRLNCRPGSGFVDISSTSDSGWALWRADFCEPDNYKNDINWEPYTQLVKNTFCLVNKKNDCGVAFVDGVPEFVRKPGNPFKLKVFHDLCVPRDVVMPDSYCVEASVTSIQHNESMDKGKISVQSGKLPCIDITFDKVALTIVHEHLDTEDLFPLLRCHIHNIHLILQILSTKMRIISTSKSALDYFDAQRNSWRELIHPVEICIFYRSSFQTRGSEIVLRGVPVHFYCRTKELNVSLTELSLDILLFVIGRLDLAGPFSVRSSKILANCCKVENQSSLDLLCHFSNKQSVTIARKQSASIFLRHLDLVNQPPERASVVSIQLAIPGSLTTSSIHLNLLEAQTLAWRTRIVSLRDSSTYPGPFVVVDISRKTEDGLTIVVSPLLRIHNETKFPMELRFRRPQEKEDEFVSVLLKAMDTIDDSMATFDAINLSGGSKKTLMSLSVGNFLLSFRPEITDDLIDSRMEVEWSDDLKGGKAVRLSGIFDKLNYKVRKALSVSLVKDSFSTAHCALRSVDSRVTNMHFLVQSIGRDVTILHPDKSGEGPNTGNSSFALREQREIFILPTVQVSNLLHSEIHVLLTESDQYTSIDWDNIGKQSTISSGSSADFYANPAMIYFNVTLTAFSSSCKPVNSSDWVKKLLKQKNDVNCLDINLDFGGGKYFASLRLSRGRSGILEAAIFTSYALKNDTDYSLFCFAPNQKPISREDAEKFGSSIPPDLGLPLPPKSTRSWFIKSNKVRLKLLEDNSSEAMLNLDALSGLTEFSLEREEESGVKYITKFGVSLGPALGRVTMPSHTVSVVARYIISNESEESVMVRQCYLEDDMAGIITISSKQKTTLQLRNGVNKRTEFSLFDNFIKKHKNANDDSLRYIQFRLNDVGLSWSGPICITSLGRFFLKFRKQSNQATEADNNTIEFAVVHVVEEGSTLVLRFNKQPNINLPYRIENRLRDTSISYYQQGSYGPELLGSECSVDYVWDDLTLPRKLVVQINDMHLPREINLDKVRGWKPFLKPWQHRGLTSQFLLGKKSGDQRTGFGEFNGLDMVKVGYEVLADGPTRVLRICEVSESLKGETVFHSCAKIQLRVSHFAVHLLEYGKQDVDEREPSLYSPILVTRLGNICLDSVFTDQEKYNQINVQSLNVDQKWVGAPFAAMLRRHQSDYSEPNDHILKIVFVLLSTRSSVKQVRYSSIILQPVDLNLDEETLMRIVPFWRTSLSKSNTPSQQYYFDHFEIHPIKIIANFLPGDSFSSYSSAQETLRSLLHSVVKVPSVKNMVVELNGVLVTHALITSRELLIRCARHYSWYAMRAVYIAKGSPLLPPAFASIFDDLASSSLDVFFDPSRGLMNLPGLTLGTFKFISKCIDGKGFSGTKRYFGDLGKTLRTAGSNVLFAAVTEISDSVLKGAEASGFNGMVSGFHQGILKLAMEPSLLGSALMEGGPNRKIKLDRSPGVDELYIEGYLQAMLDTMYKQEYLRVRVIDNQVFLKNLPPNSSLIDEIIDRVKGFLISKALLKGDPSTTTRPLRHLRGESEWKIGPTVLTLCEHLFVSFAIRMMRNQAGKFMANIMQKKESEGGNHETLLLANPAEEQQQQQKRKFTWNWGIVKFVLSGILAYIDGRLCRCIPNPVARRIVSGFLLSLLDKNDNH